MNRRPSARRRDEEEDAPVALGAVRLDRWLVAARCFKTRPVAQAACDGGHVKVNERAGEAGRAVRLGDTVEVTTPAGRRLLRITGLALRRGTAEQARGLYLDTTPPPPPDPGPAAPRERGEGRPTKRDAREIRRLKTW